MSDIPIYTVYGKTPIRKGKTYSDKDCFMVELRDYEKLQARIDELEEHMAKLNSLISNIPEMPQSMENQIKAEGIREMLEQFDMEEMPDCEGKYLSVNMMYYYADKLETKDE